MKKGFTLVELLGTILLISLLVVIIAPGVDKAVKRGSKAANDQIIENIKMAAQNWASDHKNQLPPTPNTTKDIPITTLQSLGYIDKGIELPDADGKENCVQIKNTTKPDAKRSTYKYYYPAPSACSY